MALGSVDVLTTSVLPMLSPARHHPSVSLALGSVDVLTSVLPVLSAACLHPPVSPVSGVSVLQLSVCMAFASLPKSVPRCFTLFDTIVNVLLSYFL